MNEINIRLAHFDCGSFEKPRMCCFVLAVCLTLIARFGEAEVATTPECIAGTFVPADTNVVSFVSVFRDAATSNAVLRLYAPKALPVDVFARERLDSGDWSLCASTNALHPFTELTIPSPVASRFFTVSRGDIDLDGDGYDDDAELAYDSDPMAFAPGANATIRYYYDDHLTATYSGYGQGAATVSLSPAGNPATCHERSAR